MIRDSWLKTFSKPALPEVNVGCRFLIFGIILNKDP
jgi:hypothetical protein